MLQWMLGSAVSVAAPVDLHWDAPAPCPDAEATAARIAARTPAQIGPTPVPAPVRVDARVAAVGTGYALTLALARPGGPSWRRDVTSDRCDELAEATALIVAVALDPVFLAEQAPAPGVPPPASPAGPSIASPWSRPSTPPATPRDAPATTSSRAPFGVALRPSVGAWFGALPRIGAAIGVDVVLPARRALRMELGALAIPRQRTTVAPDAGAQLWLATAVLRGCFAPAVGRVRPMACVGVAAGAIGGRGRGSAVASTAATQPWASAVAATGLEVAIVRWLGAFARVEGHAHLRRPGFHLDAVGPVHRTGQASATALVGLQAVLR